MLSSPPRIGLPADGGWRSPNATFEQAVAANGDTLPHHFPHISVRNAHTKCTPHNVRANLVGKIVLFAHVFFVTSWGSSTQVIDADSAVALDVHDTNLASRGHRT